MIRLRVRSARWLGAAALGIRLFVGTAAAESPFEVVAKLERAPDGPQVRVRIVIPKGHYLYAESVDIQPVAPLEWAPVSAPTSSRHRDPHTEDWTDIFEGEPEWVYRVTRTSHPMQLEVRFQGCNKSVCFFPETRTLSLDAPSSEAGPPAAPPVSAPSDWKTLAARFEIRGRAVGYLSEKDFLAFLDRVEKAEPARDRLSTLWETTGVWAVCAAILIGGLALNFTPCVLPLIPVNLAIIGAGTRAASRRRGFALGATYGLGMAVAYGGLGLIAVLTQAPFGALNASPVFNAGIAALFFVLALAMFDVIEIDLSRFQKAGPGRGATWGGVFLMGALTAVLAGACVAPVLISTLLLAGNLYARGLSWGLLLPFLLGVGMALPWPFAGAGLSLLPKPGRWMTVLRNLFGTLILLLALYYGYTAWSLFRSSSAGSTPAEYGATSAEDLASELEKAAAAKQPVFLDFWATWCKVCHAMERTTLRRPEVRKRLAAYRVVKFQAEHPQDEPALSVLRHFGAGGLPTYVVLAPTPDVP